MFSQTFMLGAYSPGLAQEQSGKMQDQMSIVDGRNFAWKLAGVFSAHSGRTISHVFPGVMRHPHITLVNDQQHVLTGSGVYYYDETGTPTRVLSFALSLAPSEHDLGAYQWSEAYVGTRLWFSHPQVEALIFYDYFEDAWGTYRNPCWTGPIYGITHADNRLVVLLRDAVVWSRFDQGNLFGCDDFPSPLNPPPAGSSPEIVAAWQKQWEEADWRCGSGAQSLALIRYGQPYAVMPYLNGWLTFTSAGTMFSRPTVDQTQDPDWQRLTFGALVFNHEEASFENMPVGPTAITHVDEKQVIWLSTTGLWQFAGTQGGGLGAVQLWQPEMGRYYAETVMYGWSEDQPLDSYMLSAPRHTGFLFVSSRSNTANLAYDRAHTYQLGLDRWGSFDHNHMAFGSELGARQKQAEQAMRSDAYAYMTHTFRIHLVDHMAGDPNSWVRLSPLRLQLPNEDLPPSTVSSVQEIRLGHSGPGYETAWPAHLVSSWRREQEATDRATRCKIIINSGDDAETKTVDEGEYAWLVSADRQSSLYACHTTGIAHSLVITALDAGEYFNIRHVELGFFWAGVK